MRKRLVKWIPLTVALGLILFMPRPFSNTDGLFLAALFVFGLAAALVGSRYESKLND